MRSGGELGWGSNTKFSNGFSHEGALAGTPFTLTHLYADWRRRALKSKSKYGWQMRCRGGGREPIRPPFGLSLRVEDKGFLPPPPHPLHPLSASPHRPAENTEVTRVSRHFSSPGATVEGKSEGGGGGVGEAAETAWDLMGLPPPPTHCISIRLSMCGECDRNIKKSSGGLDCGAREKIRIVRCYHLFGFRSLSVRYFVRSGSMLFFKVGLANAAQEIPVVTSSGPSRGLPRPSVRMTPASSAMSQVAQS